MGNRPGTRPGGAARIGAVTIATAVVLIAVGAAIAMGVAVAASVHGSTIDIALRFNDAGGFGRRSGLGLGGVQSQSITTQTLVRIAGLSPLSIGLHLAGGALGSLAPLAIAWFAARLGAGLWRRRPFAAPAGPELVIASAALLALTVASQLTLWLSQVTVLSELPYWGGTGQFSLWPAFDPFLPATALGLLIIALGFQLGSRVDRLTEGLV